MHYINRLYFISITIINRNNIFTTPATILS
nr:MAG TPA: hypothetical protein [Bacteriophage sp.]